MNGVDDRAEIVARLRSEQLLADQRVNFTVAYLDRDAAQALSPPLSARALALSCRGAGCGRGARSVRRHLRQATPSIAPSASIKHLLLHLL